MNQPKATFCYDFKNKITNIQTSILPSLAAELVSPLLSLSLGTSIQGFLNKFRMSLDSILFRFTEGT